MTDPITDIAPPSCPSTGRSADLVVGLHEEPSEGPSADLVASLSGLKEPSLHPSDPLSRYSFGAVFASGGLGLIRRTFDRRLRRDVAVKELQRFVRDGINIGWPANGEPYSCMKLIEGTSLHDLVRTESP